MVLCCSTLTVTLSKVVERNHVILGRIQVHRCLGLKSRHLDTSDTGILREYAVDEGGICLTDDELPQSDFDVQREATTTLMYNTIPDTGSS
jgi:hypothetical protein